MNLHRAFAGERFEPSVAAWAVDSVTAAIAGELPAVACVESSTG